MPSRSKPFIQYPFDSQFWHGYCCHDTSPTFKGRNLCVCIDGTANKFGDKNTNVIEIYNMIIKGLGSQQLTWYNSGIGTYASPSDRDSLWQRLLQKLNSVVELAFATRFEDTILGAYGWLSNNYEDGDRIFLFGFSRGAFQVRVLAAMIDRVGLFYKGNDMQIAFAYEVYRDTKGKNPSSVKRFNDFLVNNNKKKINRDDETYTSMAEHFKKTFSQKNVRVHFVGVWDTVSSLGLVRGQKMLPGTIDGMKHVCYFRHALALDERRVKFLPEYVYGGRAEGTDEPDTGETATSQIPKDPNVIPQILEVWFAGSHSDIGGGNKTNLGLNSRPPPLRWMVYEAVSVGLRTERWALEPKRVNNNTKSVDIKESLHRIWWLLEGLPIKRLTHSRGPKAGGEHTTRSLHLGAGRKLHNGQKIHESVDLHRYTPKARPPPLPSNAYDAYSESWDRIRDNFDAWKVVDADTAVRALVRCLHDPNNDGSESTVLLKRLSSSKRDDVHQAIYEEVIQILTSCNGGMNKLSEKDKTNIIFIASDMLKDSKLKLYDFKEIRREASESAMESKSADFRRRVYLFLHEYTRWWIPVRGHNNYVSSVAFSPHGSYIVSAYRDGMICLWDSTKMKQIMSFSSGLENKVDCVVFSADGQSIVSGSSDGALRIWDLKNNMYHIEQLPSPSDMPPAQIWAVASFEGGIVAGTSTGMLQIWRWRKPPNSGMSCARSWKAHTRQICTVAVSQDGRKIVSGSRDNTLCVWDAHKMEKIGGSLRGHTDWVRSVALSSDGKTTVSGSDDKTVRLWNLETGEQIGKSLEKHTRRVLSVHFSPDGRFVVSGSEDKTVRIWDVSTHQEAIEANSKHTAPVSSVAFSPKGDRVISGSDDHTIGIWDLSLMLSQWNTSLRPINTPDVADTSVQGPTKPPADESKPASSGVPKPDEIKAASPKTPKAEQISAVSPKESTPQLDEEKSDFVTPPSTAAVPSKENNTPQLDEVKFDFVTPPSTAAVPPKEDSTPQVDEVKSNIVTPPSRAPQLEAQLKSVRVEVTSASQPTVGLSNGFLQDMLVWI